MRFISDGEVLHPPVAERARRKALLYAWLLAVAFLVGAPSAYFVANTPEVSYTAEGSLWIEDWSRQGPNDAAAIQAGGQLDSNAWNELLRSHRVLEPVVVDQRLYLLHPEEPAHAFASFTLAEEFVPGTYELRVGDRAEDFVLVNGQGTVIQRESLGLPIGQGLGFIWTPSPGSFQAGAIVEFSVLSLRDAGENLSQSLMVKMDRRGNFLQVGLTGPDPNKVADVLNAVMDRHVDLAAELKKSKLGELQALLEGQLQTAELELEQAGRDLDDFKMGKSRASSDRTIPLAEQKLEEERLSRQLQIAQDLYSQLQRRFDTARLAAASSTPDVRILDRVSPPARPKEDTRVPIAMAIFLGSIAAALGGAMILNRMATDDAAAS